MKSRELIAIREAMGISQADLAALLGTTQATISRWETGEHKIPSIAAKLIRIKADERAQPATA